MKMPILTILGHFWPVFGLSWSPYQFSKLSMSVFDLVLTGLSEIGEKNLNNDDLLDENADFGHFWAIFGLFLARVPV